MRKNKESDTKHDTACGCGHDYKHEHHDGCGCGHDHGHEHHDSCDCGHDHKHEHHDSCSSGHDHKHEHHDSCGCGHDHHHHHHHDDGCGCGCGHDHGSADVKHELIFIGAGVVFLVASLFFEGILQIILQLISYLILGTEILIRAGKGLLRGSFADENFLMSIATVGAIALGDYGEAVMVMLLYRAGELLQSLAVNKSRSSIRETINLRPDVAHLLMNGVENDVSPFEVKVGSEIVIRPGERVPLDGTVISGESFMDCAAITGESVPVRVQAGDEVLSGSINKAGLLSVRTTKIASESTAARIMDAIEDAVASKPRLETFIRRFSKVYTPAVMALTLLVAIIPPIFNLGQFSVWLKRGLLLLVVSCPCALVLSVPLTFFAGLARQSKEGVLLKGANILEALSKIKAVAFDKTGTLTEGTFTITDVKAANGFTDEDIIALAASVEKGSLHPIAHAIETAAKTVFPCENMQETAGYGITGTVNGKKVTVGNMRLMQRENVSVSNIYEGAGTCVYVAVNSTYAGRIVIGDSIRESAKDAVGALKKRHCAVALLTGDNRFAANAVAKEAGVEEVHAALLPGDKLTHLKQIREEHGPVLFVGDGINDSPVLAGADVGCAIGFGGTDAAVEAADVVLMSDNLTKLPAALTISERTMRIAWQNVVFALGVKFLVMILGIFGYAEMWMAVFADVGVAFLCVLNAVRLLIVKKR